MFFRSANTTSLGLLFSLHFLPAFFVLPSTAGTAVDGHRPIVFLWCACRAPAFVDELLHQRGEAGDHLWIRVGDVVRFSEIGPEVVELA